MILLSLNIFAAVCTLLYLSSSLLNNTNRENSTFEAAASDLSAAIVQQDSSRRILTPVKKIVTQPCTHISHIHVVLAGVINDMKFRNEKCVPEDFNNLEKHRLPRLKNNKNPDSQGTMAVYISVGLLLFSLGAAFLEFYKAKVQPTNNSKNKPVLTRRCSLADLTVLRHSRKESMKRESGDQEMRGPLKLLGRKVSRPPLRLE